MVKFLNGVCLFFIFFMLSDCLVYAERKCTRTVINADGSKTTISSCSTSLNEGQRDCSITVAGSDETKNITVDCSSTFTKNKNSDIVRNPDNLKYLENGFFDKTNDSLRAIKDRAEGHSIVQADTNEKAAEVRRKAQEAVDAVRIKQQEQKDKH